MGCLAFGHGGFAASCSLKAAASLLGHYLARRRSLKAPTSLEMGESIRFSGPAAFKLQAMGRPKSSLVVPKLAAAFKLQAQIAGPKGRRPSDAKGGGEAADRGAEGDEGPSRPASPEA